MEMDTHKKRDNSGRLKQSFSKIAFRGKEKVLRTFGVVEETKDEIIDNYLHLVTKQQSQFQKFQRDMKLYLQAIQAMRQAANNFHSSLNEIYEDAWLGKDTLSSLAKTSDYLYNNLHSRLNTEVTTALQDHLTQCNELKFKTQKRGRKLVDYDAARRSLETLQSGRRLEESKLTKAREVVEQTHDTYETLNRQLHEELPDLHDSRVLLSTDVIRSIASAEKAFLNEQAERRSELLDLMANMKDAYNRGEYKIQRLHSPFNRLDESAQRSTMLADEAVMARSRVHQGDHNDRSYTSSFSSTEAPSSFSEDWRLPPRPPKPHNYVNVEVGKSSDSQETASSVHERSDNIYSAAEFDESTEEQGPSQQVLSDLPKNVQEIPKPSPRLHARKLRTSTGGQSEENAQQNDNLPEADKSPSTNLTLLSAHYGRDVATKKDISSKKTEETLTTVQASSDNFKNDLESTNKRNSFVSSWVSSLTRPKKKFFKSKSEEDTPEEDKDPVPMWNIFRRKSKKSEESKPLSVSSEQYPESPVDAANIQTSRDAIERRFDYLNSESDPSVEVSSSLNARNDENDGEHKSTTDEQEMQQRDDNARLPSESDVDNNSQSCISPYENTMQDEEQCDDLHEKLSLPEDAEIQVTTTVDSVADGSRPSSTSEVHVQQTLQEHISIQLKEDGDIDQPQDFSVNLAEDKHVQAKPAVDEELAGQEYDSGETNVHLSVVDEGIKIEIKQDDDDLTEEHGVSNLSNENDNEDVRAVVRNDIIQDNSVSRSSESSQTASSDQLVHASETDAAAAIYTFAEENHIRGKDYEPYNESYDQEKSDLEEVHRSQNFFIPNRDTAAVCVDDRSVSISDDVRSSASDIDLESLGSLQDLSFLNMRKVEPNENKGFAEDLCFASSDDVNLTSDQVDAVSKQVDATSHVLVSGSLDAEQIKNILATSGLPVSENDLTSGIDIQIKQGVSRSKLAELSNPLQEDAMTSDAGGYQDYQTSDKTVENLHDNFSPAPLTGPEPLAFASSTVEKAVGADGDEKHDVEMNYPDSAPASPTSYEPIDVVDEDDLSHVDVATSRLESQICAKDSEKTTADQPGMNVYTLPDGEENVNFPPTRRSQSEVGKETPEYNVDASKEILPPYFLYKAEALYPYRGADDDELTFVKGDVIYVVDFPDPDEQDEGWQMGILKSTWDDTGSTSTMAVFPENFTKRL